MSGTNTLVYYEHLQIVDVKSFIAFGQGYLKYRSLIVEYEDDDVSFARVS